MPDAIALDPVVSRLFDRSLPDPLTINEVADVLGVHRTTVSEACKANRFEFQLGGLRPRGLLPTERQNSNQGQVRISKAAVALYLWRARGGTDRALLRAALENASPGLVAVFERLDAPEREATAKAEKAAARTQRTATAAPAARQCEFTF